VNFTRRAGDGGNRWIRHLARRILARVRADDIILLHDVRPGNPDRCRLWLGEVDRLLWGLRKKHLRILPLPELIGKPVMGRSVPAVWPPDAGLVHPVLPFD
jgi:hypothetical protein